MIIDKPLTKNRDSDMLRVTGNEFSVGSAVMVVVIRGNIAMVRAD